MSSIEYIRDDRVLVRSPLGARDMAAVGPKCETVQFDAPLTDSDFRCLADFLHDKPEIELYVYGHYDLSGLDLEFLHWFPFLTRLNINLYELSSLDGLRHTPTLERLWLRQTRTRYSLRFLERYPNLTELAIEKHRKNIDVISGLTKLRSLWLRMITLPDLSLLLPLTQLRKLEINFGGTRDLSLLPRIGKLEELSLCWIRGLSDLSVLAELVHLQKLSLYNMPQVKALPSLRKLTKLRWVWLESMKGLRDLSPVRDAPGEPTMHVITG